MQAGIALLAFLSLGFWGFGLYYLRFVSSLWHHGFQEAKRRAKVIHERNIKHKEKVIEGLIEFHKAQCFFMLAIQVAALAARHGRLLDRSSLQQINNDNAFINVLATGGYLPVTFVLYVLRTVGHKSWYTLFLSACTIAVSAATLFSAR